MADSLEVVTASSAFAALGYVGKLVVESISRHGDEKKARRAKLVEFQSILRASKVSFQIQNEHVKRLVERLIARDPAAYSDTNGYEATMIKAFPGMTSDERELHEIIRSMTVNAMRPTNLAASEWLKGDTYFKGNSRAEGDDQEFALALADLEAHLLLWHAKYDVWIPNRADHAIVYLADENDHGLPFPAQIDDLTAAMIGRVDLFDRLSQYARRLRPT